MPRKTRRSNKSGTPIKNKIIDDGKPHYDQANIKKIPKLHRFINQISDIISKLTHTCFVSKAFLLLRYPKGATCQ